MSSATPRSQASQASRIRSSVRSTSGPPGRGKQADQSVDERVGADGHVERADEHDHDRAHRGGDRDADGGERAEQDRGMLRVAMDEPRDRPGRGPAAQAQEMVDVALEVRDGARQLGHEVVDLADERRHHEGQQQAGMTAAPASRDRTAPTARGMWKRRSHVADAARGTAMTSAIVTSMTIWTSSSNSRPAASRPSARTTARYATRGSKSGRDGRRPVDIRSPPPLRR